MSLFSSREPPQTPHNFSGSTPFTPIPSHIPATGNFAAYPASLSSTPTLKIPATGSQSSWKRKDKENTNKPKQKKRKEDVPKLTVFQKLQTFYGFLKHKLDWTYGDLLFHTSLDFSGYTGSTGMAPLTVDVHSNSKWQASREHMAAVMRHFFNGNSEYPPAVILSNWMKHPYGRLQRDSTQMFSTNPPYTEIKPVRAALTLFAVQTVQGKLVREAEDAIDVSSGLHISLSNKKATAKKIKWTDIGSSTVESSRKAQEHGGVVELRKKQPAELVVTSVISSLDFLRSSHAKLLPLATALLFFGSSASTELFRYGSRLGIMPAYSTALHAMCSLSEQEAVNYLLQCDLAIGRENRRNIGLAATYYEIELSGADISAFDLNKKRQLISQGLQSELTVAKLQKMVNHTHLENVCLLQWMNTLAHWIPELSPLKPDICLLYHTCVAKQRLEVKQSKIHPLASSSRAETVLTDFKEALQDFLAQTGQTAKEFKPRLFPIGGDGLKFEKILQLQEYLQFHDSPFDPLKIIGHKKLPNLKKVDFYTSIELANLILDVRILDCWQLYFKQENLFKYFTDLAHSKKLPCLEDLEVATLKLYQSYTSLRGQEKAMQGGRSMADSTVPKGMPSPSTTPFLGDQVLARSVSFICDAMFASEGDVGWLWEIMKVMVFTFAGSTHTNYTKYLLEMITKLELESDDDLQKGLLQLSLVNLSSREGHWSAGDFIQEYFNCLLEAIVQCKGVEYGDKFIQNAWSHNIHHVARLKLSWFDGLGLKPRSATHRGAKQDAEVCILLKHYRTSGLHSFHAGRTFDLEPYVDDFEKGIQQLQKGKLQKWIHKTTRACLRKSMEPESSEEFVYSGSRHCVSRVIDDEDIDRILADIDIVEHEGEEGESGDESN
ncbi:hypothetical protein BYT27DRAFT_7228135 [Phlegmacium glaucopus]|nr:hypothetical protein BYT27DRAFT_7228135 [Phlegmacium glaucopus]